MESFPMNEIKQKKVIIEQRHIEELVQLSNNKGKKGNNDHSFQELWVGHRKENQQETPGQKSLGYKLKTEKNLFSEVIRAHYPNPQKVQEAFRITNRHNHNSLFNITSYINSQSSEQRETAKGCSTGQLSCFPKKFYQN